MDWSVRDRLYLPEASASSFNTSSLLPPSSLIVSGLDDSTGSSSGSGSASEERMSMTSSSGTEPLREGAAEVDGVLLFDAARSPKASKRDVWRDFEPVSKRGFGWVCPTENTHKIVLGYFLAP